jgi:hypothetical protein
MRAAAVAGYSSSFRSPSPNVASTCLILVQAGLTEILAAQQLVLGAGGQLAYGLDVQPLKGLSAADG